jgi:hypothetical protein
MMPTASSEHVTKLDINNLPTNQQDRVIRFASELAKTFRQIQLGAEPQQKNENAQQSSPHITRKTNNNDRK